MTEKLGMQKFFRRKTQKTGLPPGTPVYIGAPRKEAVRVSQIEYSESSITERDLTGIDDFTSTHGAGAVNWINLDGIHDVKLIEKLGGAFDLHPLILEDLVNPWQRPKFEDFENYLFMVIKMLHYDEQQHEVRGEQVSLVLGGGFVLSFQERPGDVFDPVRNRLRSGKGKLRRSGPDYLAYALLDAVVDHYFLILEKIGERIEELEDGVMGDPQPGILHELHHLRREMIFLRKAIWPLREVIATMERGESRLFTPTTQKYLRDVYDHSIQVIETVETYRDMVAGMHDTYLSGISNRMNEIMKVLTIIATIFIPLTFLAGIYGMNFNFMPELRWRWGYPAVWILMTALAGVMIFFFRKKRWL